MESINSNFVASPGKPVQYGKFTLLDISEQLTKIDGPINMDTMTVYVRDPEQERNFWKRFLNEDALKASPAMSGVKQELDTQRSAAIERFLDGDMTEAELADTARSMVSKLRDACIENGYPVPLQGKSMHECMIETFYSDFRREILSAAVRRSNDTGKQYMTGEMNARRVCKYYDADFYYMSETAVNALTEGITSFAQEHGYDFQIPDYKAKGLNMYYNYNTAFSNSFDMEQRYILDPDQVPPEGFVWFYETGGSTDRGNGRCLASWSVDENGNICNYEYYGPTGFDLNDSLTARTWAAYRDKDGTVHRIETELVFKNSKEDLYNLVSLLRFSGGDSAVDARMNQFLKNFQLYPQGYWSRFPEIASLNCYG